MADPRNWELFKQLVRIKGMGEIRVKVRLENDADRSRFEDGKLPKKKVRSAAVEAVVDTGAIMTLLPQEVVERLGLRKLDKRTVVLANDARVELERAGTLSLTVAEREMKTDCLIGPPGCEPLLGQLVMEALDLICDPVQRTLTPRPESPFQPTLKMKQLCRLDTVANSRYNGTMARMSLRRRKQESRAAYWRKLTPAQRLRRAAAMTAAGRKLRAAGLAALGSASLAGAAAPRTRGE